MGNGCLCVSTSGHEAWSVCCVESGVLSVREMLAGGEVVGGGWGRYEELGMDKYGVTVCERRPAKLTLPNKIVWKFSIKADPLCSFKIGASELGFCSRSDVDLIFIRTTETGNINVLPQFCSSLNL